MTGASAWRLNQIISRPATIAPIPNKSGILLNVRLAAPATLTSALATLLIAGLLDASPLTGR